MVLCSRPQNVKGPSQEEFQFRDPLKWYKWPCFSIMYGTVGLKIKVKNSKKEINLLIITIFNSLCLYLCNQHWCFVFFSYKRNNKNKEDNHKNWFCWVFLSRGTHSCFYAYTVSLIEHFSRPFNGCCKWHLLWVIIVTKVQGNVEL